MATRQRPEVLAPAGSPACLPAAVAGGADAIYMGLRHFNARGRAENFRLDALPGHVGYLHDHGVKCYVVLNTLVHDDEHPKALGLAEAAWRAGVDAALVQDLGLWQAIGKHVPGLERHASTQMTVHSWEQIETLGDLGATRVVLARELRMQEVADLTARAAAIGVETEHFVHGALCYGFSGQCLVSNFAGCRSANRGTCAQNCRFDYHAEQQSEAETHLSMRDFAAIGRVPELADAGVASLKIEGRLKGPDYVYTVSRLYRAATEAWFAGESFDLAAANDALRDVFSRGLTDAPLAGNYSDTSRLQRYSPEDASEPDATLISGGRRDGRMVVRSQQPITAGMGFRFAIGRFTDGCLVTAADRDRDPNIWQLRVRIDRRGPPLPAGLGLIRNRDQRRQAEAERAMGAVPMPKEPAGASLDLQLAVSLGTTPQLTISCRDGRAVTVTGEQPAAPATGNPLTEADIAKAIGRLGGSGFHLNSLSVSLDEGVFVPAGALKRLRRQGLDAISQAEATPAQIPTALPVEVPQVRTTRIIAVVSSLAAADAAYQAGAEQVWLENDWQSVSDVDRSDRPWLWRRHASVVAADPNPAVWRAPAVVGHLGALRLAAANRTPVIADAALNCYGVHTLQALGELGAEAVVISLECSQREIARMVGRIGQRSGLPQVLVTIHGRLPAMITRQDHGLSTGNQRQLQASEREGGLPYQLERRGKDVTVLWEGRRLCAPDAALATNGLVDGWVLELGDLDSDGVRTVVSAYRDLQTGRLTPDEVTDAAAQWAPAGLFPGHLHQGSRELDKIAGSLTGMPD